jgi:predicted regulator of Ras-like GTPase activity (Roadblock/LC7/MglB family)
MMLPTLSLTNEIIVIALLTLSVLSMFALIYFRRHPKKSSRDEHHGAEPSHKIPSRAEKALFQLIANLDKVSGVSFSAVVTTTGKLIASSSGTDEVSAHATSELLTMYDCSKRMANDLGQERIEQIMVLGKDGFLMVESMGEDVILLVNVSPDAHIEGVSKKVTHAAEKIQELLTHPRR